MPWLWAQYDYSELNIPNTNNEFEVFNVELKAKQNLHKGISEEKGTVFRSLFGTKTKDYKK